MTGPSSRITLAKNLRIIRLVRNLSQEAMADLVGMDRGYFGGIERAERNISVDSLEKMARALDVSIAELLRDPDPQQLAQDILDAINRRY